MDGHPVIAVICPTNRPERLAAWREAWRHEFDRDDVRVYIVHDNVPTREQIDRVLGWDAWIIPWRTSAIRSWGTMRAYWDDADYFIHLDDDCLPDTPDFVAQHLAALTHSGRWVSTIRGLPPRGLPTDTNGASVAVNIGLWTNVPDLDGATQLVTPPPYVYDTPTQWIPAGMYVPMSYMNLAFRRDVAPLMWLGLQGCTPIGARWGYDRFDDIWCGLFAKRICDHLGLTLRSGTPLIRHDRASNAAVNAMLEKPGKEVNEWLWRVVDAAPLTARTAHGAYEELSHVMALPNLPYWDDLRAGMRRWVRRLVQG